ncbi:hypothetical protein ACJX0J_006777, partial [Zea mays]
MHALLSLDLLIYIILYIEPVVNLARKPLEIISQIIMIEKRTQRHYGKLYLFAQIGGCEILFKYYHSVEGLD